MQNQREVVLSHKEDKADSYAVEKLYKNTQELVVIKSSGSYKGSGLVCICYEESPRKHRNTLLGRERELWRVGRQVMMLRDASVPKVCNDPCGHDEKQRMWSLVS